MRIYSRASTATLVDRSSFARMSWMSLHRTNTRVQTGCIALDRLLDGGLGLGEVTLVYGEAATGKTNLALQASAHTARNGGKVIYVDSDQSFSHQRFGQIAPEIDEQSHNIVIFSPDTFSDQTKIIDNLEKYVVVNTCLVVVDSVTTLYRATLATTEERFALNRELNRQLACLKSLANTHSIVVLVTSQVHARINTQIGGVEPVARRTLFHWPQTIMRIESTAKRNVKRIVVERSHSKNVSNITCYLTLTERGFE
jgi:DNA repair and recombination protein RadB